MLDTVNDLLTHNKIPALDEIQMSGLLHYLFTTTEWRVRFGVAEVVHRYEHDHPQALDIFLACALPLAEKLARARAHKSLVCPSEWQIEVMYDGAVEAAIHFFQTNPAVRLADGNFRRFLIYALGQGGIRAYFSRRENGGIRGVADVTKVRTSKKRRRRNELEDAMVTRDLLDRVTNFPHLRPEASAILQCIGRLGPHAALKTFAVCQSGDSSKWKRAKNATPILDPLAIAEALGTDTYTVHHYLRQARLILRGAFNADGKLFLTR